MSFIGASNGYLRSLGKVFGVMNLDFSSELFTFDLNLLANFYNKEIQANGSIGRKSNFVYSPMDCPKYSLSPSNKKLFFHPSILCINVADPCTISDRKQLKPKYL